MPGRDGWLRFVIALLALGAVFYGVHGVVVDDLYLPGKRSRGAHFHGAAAVAMCLMIAFAAGALVVAMYEASDPVGDAADAGKLLQRLLICAGICMVAGFAAAWMSR
jgi:hypothetical protein